MDINAFRQMVTKNPMDFSVVTGSEINSSKKVQS